MEKQLSEFDYLMTKPKPELEAVQQLSAAVQQLSAALKNLIGTVKEDELTNPRLRELRQQLGKTIAELDEFERSLDPVAQPEAVFDPSNPNVVGAFIALALQSRNRAPLSEVRESPFHGSGIYAIYYCGGFDVYSALEGTEHPIYTGKSDPVSPAATTPVAQGQKLFRRLKEHAKSIDKGEYIDLTGFEYRYLVVQSGWQTAAGRFLIDWFKPIWNNEMNICFGIGKHGDSSTTRANQRSPWDTLHPGRPWASDQNMSRQEVTGSNKRRDQKALGG